MKVRIQKLLSSSGIASRRTIEKWIKKNRLIVDGKFAKIGQIVSGSEKFQLDGDLLAVKLHHTNHKYIIYNKPINEISSRSDPDKRPSIFDNLPKIENSRWISVGRLDVSTSGLLLFVTDGSLANALMHPSKQIIRRYVVRIHGNPKKTEINQLLNGIDLHDGVAAFESINIVGGKNTNEWFHVTVREGRNRIIRRMWKNIGYDVSRLIRIGYGPIELPRTLSVGKYKELTEKQIEALYFVTNINR